MATHFTDSFQIRPLDPKVEAEVTLVAERMKLTLVEVIGPVEGGN